MPQELRKSAESNKNGKAKKFWMGLRECEKIELKKSTSELKEAIISISAMLNKHKEGEVYFGFNNSGKKLKQTISENTIREISRAISDNIEPKIFPKIIYSNGSINVKVSGNEAPYYAYGRAYLRLVMKTGKLAQKN